MKYESNRLPLNAKVQCALCASTIKALASQEAMVVFVAIEGQEILYYLTPMRVPWWLHYLLQRKR